MSKTDWKTFDTRDPRDAADLVKLLKCLEELCPNAPSRAVAMMRVAEKYLIDEFGAEAGEAHEAPDELAHKTVGQRVGEA